MNRMVSDLLTTGQVARLCGVTPDAVLKWIKKGKLPAVRTAGGHFRVARDALEQLGYLDAAHVCHRRGEGHHESISIPQHCWEYFCRNMAAPETCRECIVYRARIQKCYEVAELGESIGHNRRFCRADCKDCPYYRACKGLATTVLVVTDDETLQERLAGEPSMPNLVLRFARSGYETARLVDACRPAVMILDSRLPEVGDGRLVESMAADERLAGTKLVIALRRRDRAPNDPRVKVLRFPLSGRKIHAAVERLLYASKVAEQPET